MNEDLHARALELVTRVRVEGLSQSEREWLSRHLQDCGFCS